jgi:hypothetical protein|tara:strand:+ start:8658 stop:9092 length:435 start_codon:yes stop_codon:yes gene_type:complete
MNLDDLKIEWKNDCEIDDIQLDNASLEVPKLHAKYLDLLSSKLILQKQYQLKYDTLLRDKWMWYNGKFSPEELKELGWEQFDLKIMKADLHYVFNADEDLQNLKAKQEYLKITIDFLKECLTNITWRHQTIRNTIDWRKFMAGN